MTPQERAQVLDAILAIPEPWDPVRRYVVKYRGDPIKQEAWKERFMRAWTACDDAEDGIYRADG